jgi:hypothetical protein
MIRNAKRKYEKKILRVEIIGSFILTLSGKQKAALQLGHSRIRTRK